MSASTYPEVEVLNETLDKLFNDFIESIVMLHKPTANNLLNIGEYVTSRIKSNYNYKVDEICRRNAVLNVKKCVDHAPSNANVDSIFSPQPVNLL